MKIKNNLSILLFLVLNSHGIAQQMDSIRCKYNKVSEKYLHQSQYKVDRYADRLHCKTLKTLERLARWESRIRSILEKISPETCKHLFAEGQMTFSILLQQYQTGKAKLDTYTSKYDEYRDRLTNSIRYLAEQKSGLYKKEAGNAVGLIAKIDSLNESVDNSEAIQKFIQERKHELINQSVQLIGKNKYLSKIDKECYYYIESTRNLNELFRDKKSSEEFALKLLNKIPAFREFMQKNCLLVSLFHLPANPPGNTQSLAGLQTRASVNSLIQQQIASGGPNARQIIQQNIQDASGELDRLKDKILKKGTGTNEQESPDFRPNLQRSKTFMQRIEIGNDFHFSKPSGSNPLTTDIALYAGYKMNDRSIIGIGISYKCGLGNLQHLSVSQQGFGLRSYVDWKLKKQVYISGGLETNYNAGFKPAPQFKANNAWQKSALLGVSKKIQINTKWFKGSKISVQYDFLSSYYVPKSPAIVFRLGYSIK